MPKKASRLTAVVSASTAALLLLSACGGSDSASDSSSDASSSSSESSSGASMDLAKPKPADTKKVKGIKITEASGKKPPKVSFADKPLTVTQTTREVLKEGTGTEVPDDAFAEVDLAMFSGKDGKMIQGSETYTSAPIVLDLGNAGAMAGLVKSIRGQKVGAHGVSVMPPDDLFGPQGAPDYGVDGTDNLVLVYDVRGIMPTEAKGKAVAPKEGLPTVKWHDDAPADITIPKEMAKAKAKKLTTQKLIEGTGKTIKKGDQVYASYTGAFLKDGKVFDTSFKEGRGPYPFVVGQPGTIEAWSLAAEGAKVGDRLLVVVPSKYGYGKQGSPDGTIKPDTDLVFVMDILGAY